MGIAMPDGLLAASLDDGFADRKPIDQALANYEQRRNEAALPMYQFTLDLASMTPPSVEQQVMFEALRHNQEATDQFFGVLTGVISPKDFSGQEPFASWESVNGRSYSARCSRTGQRHSRRHSHSGGRRSRRCFW
jgi:hypothetical protein